VKLAVRAIAAEVRIALLRFITLPFIEQGLHLDGLRMF
jgi:hypothetical protein